jgi:surface antigen
MKSKWICTVVFLALLVVSVTGAVGAGKPIESSPATGINWETYADQEWKYTIRYPHGWTVRVVFTNGEDSPSHVIRKRVRFSGPNLAEVNVDVWKKPPDMNLMTWIGQNQRTMLELGDVRVPSTANAIVGGQASLVLMQVGTCSSPPVFFAYVPAQGRMFSIQYSATNEGNALDIYRQMVMSFSSGAERIQTETALYIPELSYPQEPAGGRTCYLRNTATCCEYTSHSAKWPCGTEVGTNEDYGNCVWWAAFKRPDVGDAIPCANAGQWATLAEAAGFPVDTTPQVGDIVVNESNPGHVAYVTSVGATTVDITGMGYCRICYEMGTYPIAGHRFIHRKGQDNIPPNVPPLDSPADGSWFSSRTVVLSWRDGGDPDDKPRNYRDFYAEVFKSGWSKTYGWTTDTSWQVTVPSDETYSWHVRAGDGDRGSEWSETRVFHVDASPPNMPAISVSGPGCGGVPNNGWQNTCFDPTFTWSATDVGGSGVQGYRYCWSISSNCPPATWTTGTSFDPVAIAPADGTATYYLNVRARDSQNHDSSIASFGVRYDGAAPTVTVQINGGAATANQTTVRLDLSAGDIGSGIADVRISDKGLNWSDWQPYANIVLWTLPALDRRTLPVYVQVRDHAGNESDVASDTITLNLYPPMPHSGNYRICADVVDTGGSVGIASSSYSLISAIGQPWATGADANTGTRFGGRAGFLSGITGCLPITYAMTSHYTVTQWIIASGGNLRGNTSYLLEDTTGQPAASENKAFTSANYVLSSGFWAQITGTVPPTTTPPSPVPTPIPTITPTPSPTPTPQPSGFGVSIDEGGLYTGDPIVTVRTWAPNVIRMRLSNDGGYSDEGWHTYRVTTTWVLSTYGDYVMPRYVYAWFRDVQSSVYGPYFDDIVYDPVPPQGNVTILDSGLITVGLWLEAHDDNSGVDQMRVGGNVSMADAAWQPYTNTLAWVLTSDVVYAQFRDRAGNLSSVYGSDGSVYDPNARRIYLPLVLRNG